MSGTIPSTSRFVRGLCTEHRRRGGGASGVASTYVLEDTDGRRSLCDYTDVVSDGFRTLEVGDPVRYETTGEVVEEGLFKARYVIRLVDHSDMFYRSIQPPSSASPLV